MSENTIAKVEEVDDHYKGEGGLYLKISEKGDSATVRIVGNPIKWEETFIDPDTGKPKLDKKGKPEGPSVRFARIVIHREPNGESVKGFRYGWDIQKKLRALVDSKNWGDLTTYDVEITNNSEQGNWYSVVPLSKAPITQAERDMVVAANLDLSAMYLRSRVKDEAPTTEAAEGEFDPFAND